MAQQFEEHVKQKLHAECADQADGYWSAYQQAKVKLSNHVYDEIKGAEPALSDHGARHIANVLHNARRLVENGVGVPGLSAVELYCLGLIILFHDVGNAYGRHDHHKKISEIYDWVRGTDAHLRRERTLVIQAARAHTGVAADGTADTLKELNEDDHLDDHPVNLRTLAAVLRFADELAEGPQRTSDFMRTHLGYPEDSRIYHDYASITSIHIDRHEGRILLTYEIDIVRENGESLADWTTRLTQLLSFTYDRIVKLDQERRYARYYSALLEPFRLTSARFNFHCGGQLLPVDLPTLLLDDKVIPGDNAMSIAERNPAFEVTPLLEQLREHVQ